MVMDIIRFVHILNISGGDLMGILITFAGGQIVLADFQSMDKIIYFFEIRKVIVVEFLYLKSIFKVSQQKIISS